MIKLLAVDMDGTCLNGKSRMTDRTLNTLRRAAGEGIIVVPTTGRNLECIPHRLAEGTLRKGDGADARANQELFRYVISSNGAEVTDIKEKKTVFQSLIPKKTAVSLMQICENQRLGKAAHIRHRYLIEGRGLTAAGRMVYGKDAAGVYCVKNLRQRVEKSPYDVEEFQFYFFSGNAQKKLRGHINDYPGLNAAYTGIYAEVFSAETSKGKALKALADHLGIRKNEIACIGDGENDLPMFESAGMRIAMGNSVPELKEKADYVTAGNNRDGAAQAIERYVLCE